MTRVLLTSIALLASCTLFLWRFLLSKTYPKAPGPVAGRFTDFWYLFKVWQGKFEVWNIDQHRLHGKIIRVSPNMYSIDDPAAVKIIYGISSPMPKSSWYRMWGDPSVPNHNLFSAEDNKVHALMRRKQANLYSMTSVKSYEPYINRCVSILVDQFDRMAMSGANFQLQHWMQCYAFDVIGELTFGSQIGFLSAGGLDVDSIMDKLEKAASFSVIAGISPWLAPLLFALLGNPLAGATAFTQKMTEAQNDRARENKSMDMEAESFLTKLEKLRAQSPEDYEQYRMNVSPLANVAAGSDTTGVSLTSIMFNIAKHPQVLEKLREELRDAEASGKAHDPISFEQAKTLPYLQMVIKEALRIHPATGLPMWRVVPEPGCTISGQFFPGGAIVGINTWVAHRNTNVFGQDAAQFRPGRWDPAANTPEQLKEMERYWLPFGAGSRTCIGRHISMLEMSKLIPKLVRRYDFELLSEELKCTNRWFVKQEDVRVKVKRVRVLV